MTLVKLTMEQALEGLDKAVEEKGSDYIYPQGGEPYEACVYFLDGKPSCIVGNVLAQHGVTADAIRDYNTSGVKELLTQKLLECDEVTASLLAFAQDMQDAGKSWGESVTRAKRAVSMRAAA